MEGERFCYKGGLFNGRGNGHVREVDICIFYCILWSISIVLFLVYSISYL